MLRKQIIYGSQNILLKIALIVDFCYGRGDLIFNFYVVILHSIVTFMLIKIEEVLNLTLVGKIRIDLKIKNRVLKVYERNIVAVT